MNIYRIRFLLGLAAIGIAALGGYAVAGQIVSTGSATDASNGSIQNVGQTAIGVIEDANIRMHVGGLYVLHTVSCTKGDVDLNGLIDGADIDEYLMAYIDGVGTAQQLCAAEIEVDDFVALLLAQ